MMEYFFRQKNNPGIRCYASGCVADHRIQVNGFNKRFQVHDQAGKRHHHPSEFGHVHTGFSTEPFQNRSGFQGVDHGGHIRRGHRSQADGRIIVDLHAGAPKPSTTTGPN